MALNKFKKRNRQNVESPRDAAQNPSYILSGLDADVAVATQAMTKAAKFYEHKKPQDLEVDDTDDITALSLQQVGQMLQYFTSYHAYALVEFAKADQQATVVGYAHDSIKKQTMLRLDAGQQKYKLDAAVAADAAVKHAYLKLLEAEATKSMMKVVTEGIREKMELYSREITRRQTERTQGQA
jgi:hypothetical protein